MEVRKALLKEFQGNQCVVAEGAIVGEGTVRVEVREGPDHGDPKPLN